MSTRTQEARELDGVLDEGTVRVPEGGPSFFERLLGAVAAVVFLASMSMVFIARWPLRDPDVWWHIVMGHAYLDGSSVRHPGAMSPFGTEDWHSRDWLTQMAMALSDSAFGLSGVAWLLGFALVVLFIATFRLCRRAVPFGPASVATGTAFFGMIGSLSPRPQVVSFILLAVTVGALLRTVDDLRPRWWLAPLAALWACTHGLWFLVLVLQVLMMIGLIMDRRLNFRACRPFVALIALCVAAVAVTPNGIHQLTHPLGSSMGIARYVMEYQPTSIGNPPYTVTLMMFAVVCITWARRGNVSWVEVFFAGLGLFFAVYMGRTIALGSIMLVPFFARAVAFWWPEARAFLSGPVERSLVYGGALLSLILLSVIVPQTANAPDDYFPSEYDARLVAMPDDAVLLNELGDGGYLAWKYPELRIVGDGLTDQYSVEWLAHWYGSLRGEPGWEEFVDRSGADYALLRNTTPLRMGLLAEGWVQVKSTDDRVLLRAPHA